MLDKSYQYQLFYSHPFWKSSKLTLCLYSQTDLFLFYLFYHFYLKLCFCSHSIQFYTEGILKNIFWHLFFYLQCILEQNSKHNFSAFCSWFEIKEIFYEWSTFRSLSDHDLLYLRFVNLIEISNLLVNLGFLENSTHNLILIFDTTFSSLQCPLSF